jgi:DNA-binding MarR family transcriptional regulator
LPSSPRSTVLAQLRTEVRGWQADQDLFDATVAEAAGLNRTTWRCLDLLGTRGPMTAGELARAARLTTGAVTAVLDQLEAAGLVRRERDATDRRRVIVHVTDEVDRRAAPVFGPLMADSDAALEAFSEGELEAIVRFIRGERSILVAHTARVGEALDAASDAGSVATRRRAGRRAGSS